MEFKKVAWFYQIVVNGESKGTVQKVDAGENKGKWMATGADNWIYLGKTRKEAATNLIEQNR